MRENYRCGNDRSRFHCIEKVMGDYQNGFRDGRSAIDNIFALKIINEKLWEYNQGVQYLFIGFQKAYGYT